MSSIKSRVSKPHRRQSHFPCKICKRNHGLRFCQTFLKMTVEKRMQTVISHNYCPNCLAHMHSSRSCFSTLGCKHCGGSHHTSLHIHKSEIINRIAQTAEEDKPVLSTSTSKLTSASKKVVSLESITIPYATMLFPTAVVNILIGSKKHHVRAVIDQCTSVSKISQRLVKDLNISTTILGDDTICSVIVQSRQAPHVTLEVMMTVNNRISMDTPKKSIPASTVSKFPNMTLADPQFYKSGPFAIVFGADVYSKIIQPGLLPSNTGLPVAWNTIFGWVLSGSCSY